MRIEISRTGRNEKVAVTRPDGSGAGFTIPSKGPVSHDIVHFCVESVLNLKHGFWGAVASGEEPEAIQERAKAGGHASAKRATLPESGIVPLLQVERLVESFEAEGWSGAADDGGLRAMAKAGWAASQVPPLELSDQDIAAIRTLLEDLGGRWQAMPDGECMILDWKE